MKKIAMLLILLLVLATVLAGCELGIMSPDTPTEAEKTSFLGLSPEIKYIAVALDISGSTLAAFSEDVRSGLAGKVAASVPPRSTTPENGAEEIPGFDMTIFLIGSENINVYNDVNTVGHKLHVVLSGVPTLDPRPAPPQKGVNEAYYDEYNQWKKDLQTWRDAYDACASAAKSASETILNMDITAKASGNQSGIFNAICGLIAAVNSNEMSVGVFSDLLENGGIDKGLPPNGKSGRAVLCVPAPDGDMVAANTRAEDLSGTMEAWGFDAAEIKYQGQLTAAINYLFLGG